MEFKQLEEVNSKLKTLELKGKAYVQVNTRVLAFRELYPNGKIETEIISNEDGVVLMKATVSDQAGFVLGTGHAQEKENSSYINKTSFIENCETSAVGRALAMVGIGVDASMCSAEELVNAVVNQEEGKNKVTAIDVKTMLSEIEKNGLDINKVTELFKVKNLKDMTFNQFNNFMKNIEKVKETCSLQES